MAGYDSINKEINDRIHKLATKVYNKQYSKRDVEELASLISPKLKYYIWTYCKDEYDTEEALQFSLIKIFAKIDKFNPESGRFTTWAFTIARHETLFYLDRKYKALPKYTEISLIFNNEDKENTPDSILSSKQKREDELSKIHLDTLKEISNIEDSVLRNITIDKMIKNERVKDIAKKYDMNENTVKTKLRKARKDIKTIMIRKNPGLRDKIMDLLN